MDAAIAANATLGLMEPVSNGLGGDLFAIVWDPKTKKLYGYNGSGRAAKGRDLAEMIAKVKAVDAKLGVPYAAHIPKYGSLAITVPGAVDGWGALHDRFGKLPLAEDLAPAIAYAQNGFPVTQLIAMYWKGNMKAFAQQRRDDRGDRERAAHLSGERQDAGRGRDLPQSGSRPHAEPDRQGRARRLLQGRDRAQDRRLLQAHRRRSALRGLRRRITANGSNRSA